MKCKTVGVGDPKRVLIEWTPTALGRRAESVLTHAQPTGHLPAKTAIRSTITQIYEGTNQIERMVMARQLLKG